MLSIIQIPIFRQFVSFIVNVTPDSFSDGGSFFSPETAIARALQLYEAGASVIELGAQSTRPMATVISADEEYKRLRLVLEGLLAHMPDKKIKLGIYSFYPQNILKIFEKYPIAWVNDVKSITDENVLSQLASSQCQWVAIHSLSIPPQKKHLIPLQPPPIETIKIWAKKTILRLIQCGFSKELDLCNKYSEDILPATMYEKVLCLYQLEEMKAAKKQLRIVSVLASDSDETHGKKLYFASKVVGDYADIFVIDGTDLSLATQSQLLESIQNIGTDGEIHLAPEVEGDFVRIRQIPKSGIDERSAKLMRDLSNVPHPALQQQRDHTSALAIAGGSGLLASGVVNATLPSSLEVLSHPQEIPPEGLTM